MRPTPATPSAARFQFLAEALHGAGGFAPRVHYKTDAEGLSKPGAVSGECYLVPYPRETADKFAARAAVAVYENHLRSACDRFVGYISRRQPQREGLQNPLLAALADDADWSGNDLGVFWQGFMVEAKARGSMLLLIEQPAEQASTLADALERRLVPYLAALAPERVIDYALTDRGRFAWISFHATHDGEPAERYYDAQAWRVTVRGKVVAQGRHSFGECPVLAFTEKGAFPCVGTFAQIADLSRRHYNARSELDEILRSQTFSLLAYQVPPEALAQFTAAEAAKVAASVGTHNMLIYTGEAPRFIAPSDGPAATYLAVLDNLSESIRRVGFAIDEPKYAASESGVALTIRFQALNGALGSFAKRMQDLEDRMWAAVGRSLGLSQVPSSAWATDYSLADLERELALLSAMRDTGFPESALATQRKRIAAEQFDNLGDDELAQLLADIDAAEHVRADPADPGADPNTDPNTD